MPSSCFPDSFAQVRLVDSQGEFTGIMTSNQARARANEEGLDLVVEAIDAIAVLTEERTTKSALIT